MNIPANVQWVVNKLVSVMPKSETEFMSSTEIFNVIEEFGNTYTG
jgi:hypothetical protein